MLTDGANREEAGKVNIRRGGNHSPPSPRPFLKLASSRVLRRAEIRAFERIVHLFFFFFTSWSLYFFYVRILTQQRRYASFISISRRNRCSIRNDHLQNRNKQRQLSLSAFAGCLLCRSAIYGRERCLSSALEGFVIPIIRYNIIIYR